MHAIDMLSAILTKTVDAPYTVDSVTVISPATIWITGHFHLDNGAIEDQLIIGLRTYFRIKEVCVHLEYEADDWLLYSAKLTRVAAFAQVQS